eukprot:14706368-Alexandrium_andersonii.AAC.1
MHWEIGCLISGAETPSVVQILPGACRLSSTILLAFAAKSIAPERTASILPAPVLSGPHLLHWGVRGLGGRVGSTGTLPRN